MKKTPDTHVTLNNESERLVELPPIPSTAACPKGHPAVAIPPGIVHVERSYWDVLTSYTVKNRFDVEHAPHANIVERLASQKVTIDYSQEALEQPEGLPPPESLTAYPLASALQLVASETDRKVLRNWHDNAPRHARELRDAIEKRVNLLDK